MTELLTGFDEERSERGIRLRDEFSVITFDPGVTLHTVNTFGRETPAYVVDEPLESRMMYVTYSVPVCGERTLATAKKLSEQANWARIISICPLHNIVGV